MNTKIYVAHHKEGHFFQTEDIYPIHVGKGKDNKNIGINGDNTGDNISKKNDNYCELTALYWMWKNDKSCDYTGLMHYRRYFDFSESYKEHFQTEVFLEGKTFDFEEYERKDAKCIKKLLEEYDIILPQPHKMPFSVEFNYRDIHHGNDLETLKKIIIDLYPEYIPSFEKCMKRETFYLFNMFVCKRSIFEKYAEWLFDILFQLEKEIDIEYYTVYQSRVFGFLSERLFGVFIDKYTSDNPQTKTKYLKVLNLAGAIVLPIKKINLKNVKDEDINIVVSSDHNYAPHLAALFASISNNASNNHKYNIFVLSSGLYESDIHNFNMIFSNKNIELYIINIDNFFSRGFRSNRTLPSYATYNRFLIYFLLKDLKRVLYIDADMIVLDDLVELYNVDMKSYPIAVVTDYVMTRCLNLNVKLPDGYPDLRTYLMRDLNMDNNDIARYFNAGLILFNLVVIDCEKTGKLLLEEAQSKKYYFQDQDILNKHYKKNFMRLSAEYNVFNSNTNEYSHVPWKSVKEVNKAKRNPRIIHYAAAHNKPWLHSPVPYDYFYWKYLRETSYYEQVLLNMYRKSNQSKMDQLIYGIKDELLGTFEEQITTRRIIKAFKRTVKNKLLKPLFYGTFVHKYYRRSRNYKL